MKINALKILRVHWPEIISNQHLSRLAVKVLLLLLLLLLLLSNSLEEFENYNIKTVLKSNY